MKPFVFTVTVEVERSEGKFAPRDEMTDKIREELEGADPGSIYTDNDATYDVVTWNVMEES